MWDKLKVTALRYWLSIGTGVLFLAAVACQTTATPTPTPTATPTPTPTPAPTLIPAEQDALSTVWRAAEVVRRSYVETGIVALDVLVAGAIQDMLQAAEVPSYPFLTRLDEAQDTPPPDMPSGLEDIWRAWRLLLTEHPKVDLDALSRSAIQGMLTATGDPAAQFLPGTEYHQAQEFFQGTYEGIGAIVQRTEDGQAIITAVVSGGPSDQSGLRTGDVILAVDGIPATELSLIQLVERLRGAAGTQVTMQIQRRQQLPIQIRLTRGEVSLPTVATDVLPGDIGYMYDLFVKTPRQPGARWG